MTLAKQKPRAKNPRANQRAGKGKANAGQRTLDEIFSQPEMWSETSRRLEQEGTLAELAGTFSGREPWLFVACGSSYYLSQLVATLWAEMLRVPCAAVPASEFLFAPEETLRRTGARQVVLVSRSGETTEVLRVAEYLRANPNIPTLGATCSAKSPLETLCTKTLKLTWADEKSTVMTRSFTCMLLAFEELGAKFAGDLWLASAPEAPPERVRSWLEANAGRIQRLGARRRFKDFVFLGQGAHYWLAQEAALKVTEMSSSYAQAYHTLEFRHGPRSIASRDTLITFLISGAAAEEESRLVPELKALGATTFVVVNRTTPALEAASDLLIELGLEGPEWARLAATAIPAQILGAAVGLKKGLNPDAPRNLSRVVTLSSDGNSRTKRRTN